MLYPIKTNDPFKEYPELKMVPEFQPLSESRMAWIILVHDYKSPYRNYPIDERKEVVANDLQFRREKGGRFDFNARQIIQGKDELINKAVEKYKKLQFNQERETLLAFDNQLRHISELLSKEDKSQAELKLALDAAVKLPQLLKIRKELEVIAGDREDTGMTQKENMSIIDQVNEDEG
jgi:hypothetical protein